MADNGPQNSSNPPPNLPPRALLRNSCNYTTTFLRPEQFILSHLVETTKLGPSPSVQAQIDENQRDQNYKRQPQASQDSAVDRRQQSRPFSSTPDADETTLILSRQQSPGQLEQQQPQPNWAAIWTRFKTHRDSADYYLKQYLGCLDIVDVDEPTTSRGEQLSTQGQLSANTMATRWKISADSAIRDLLVMEEIVEMVEGKIKPSKSRLSPILAMGTLVSCISAATVPDKAIAGVSAASAVVGALGLIVPPTWYNIKSYKMRNTRARLKGLRCAFEHNNVGERHRDALEPSKFKYLRWILVYF